MNRIDSLDWQRGLLAFAIMTYHLTGWELFPLDSSSTLGRLGIYGVSMFFVLSGLSMAVVYHKYIEDAGSSMRFFVRRIFRIWPLLWFAVAFATGAAMLAGQSPSKLVIMLNLTTAFGFVQPSAYINVGAWSLGNEMVYYALTPLFIWAYNTRLVFGNLLTGLACMVGLWFATTVLTVDKSLADQWVHYINPFNNLFLYCAGIALYYNAKDLAVGTRANLACLVLALATLIFYPAVGDQIHIVSGAGRVVFSLASVLLVFAFYKNTVRIPQMIAVPLTHLGVITYGVYLLHPIAYRTIIFALKKSHTGLPPYAMIGATMALTIILALLSFKLLEEPFIRLGKRSTSRRGGAPKPERDTPALAAAPAHPPGPPASSSAPR